MYRQQNFPIQGQKIYDFYLGSDQRLHLRAYDRYQVIPAGFNRTTYRIYTGHDASYSIVNKRKDQMDRFVNGHYFSFACDRDAALAAMRKYYKTKIDESEATIANARNMLLVTEDAAKHPEVIT